MNDPNPDREMRLRGVLHTYKENVEQQAAEKALKSDTLVGQVSDLLDDLASDEVADEPKPKSLPRNALPIPARLMLAMIAVSALICIFAGISLAGAANEIRSVHSDLSEIERRFQASTERYLEERKSLLDAIRRQPLNAQGQQLPEVIFSSRPGENLPTAFGEKAEYLTSTIIIDAKILKEHAIKLVVFTPKDPDAGHVQAGRIFLPHFKRAVYLGTDGVLQEDERYQLALYAFPLEKQVPAEGEISFEQLSQAKFLDSIEVVRKATDKN